MTYNIKHITQLPQQPRGSPDVSNSKAEIGNATCAILPHENVLALDVSMCDRRFTFNQWEYFTRTCKMNKTKKTI